MRQLIKDRQCQKLRSFTVDFCLQWNEIDSTPNKAKQVKQIKVKLCGHVISWVFGVWQNEDGKRGGTPPALGLVRIESSSPVALPHFLFSAFPSMPSTGSHMKPASSGCLSPLINLISVYSHKVMPSDHQWSWYKLGYSWLLMGWWITHSKHLLTNFSKKHRY